jgi:hypothetical protein
MLPENPRFFAKMAKTPPPICGHLRGELGKLSWLIKGDLGPNE